MARSRYPSGPRLITLPLSALALTLACAHAQQNVDFAAGAGGQITFVMPTHNVECVYTPQGGTATYKPLDGGPGLSCDRRDPK
jgi:hypothetical protein